MKRFEALDLGFALAKALGPAIEIIRQHDREMAAQLRSAGTSAPSCVAEGSKRAGGDRLQLYRTASGSAAEIRVQILLAAAWGWLPQATADEIAELADRLTAITWRLSHPRK